MEAAFAKMVRAAVFLVLRLVASADHWFELGEQQDDQGLSLPLGGHSLLEFVDGRWSNKRAVVDSSSYT